MKSIIRFITVMALLIAFATPVSAGEIFEKASGTWQGTKNTLNFSYPYKGDLYFGGNTGTVYGTYSHAAVARNTTSIANYSFTYTLVTPNQTVSGNGWTGLTVEATPTSSTTNDVISRDVHRFWFYDWAAEAYVNEATSTERTKAADKALTYSGIYDWNSTYSNNTTWQCAKLASRAFKDTVGIELGDDFYWLGVPYPLYPDHVYFDSGVTSYTTSSAVSELNLPKDAVERLEMWKDKGVDLSDVQFEIGVHKKGFGRHLLKMEQDTKLNKAKFKERIKSKFQIDDLQYTQLIEDAKQQVL